MVEAPDEILVRGSEELLERAVGNLIENSRKFGGAEARITFYLDKDAVQAFDLRFEARDLQRVAQFLRAHYGAPETQGRQKIEHFGKTRELYKMRWRDGADQAVLTSQIGHSRFDLNVWRGDFDSAVYRIK